MMIARRTFLLGFAAVLATPALAKYETFTGPMSTGVLDPRLPARKILDVLFSSMPTGEELRSSNWREEPVQWTFSRGEITLLHVMLNPRASTRWVAAPGCEFHVRRQDVLRVMVEPCHTETALTLLSDINLESDSGFFGDETRRPRMFAECYHWRDGKPTLSSIAAVHPSDQHVLEGEA